MRSQEIVENFLNRNGWQLIKPIELGTTAHIFVVEKGNARQVLKILREGISEANTLKTEHRVLQVLNTTEMRQYVPGVGEWLQELNGFLMEYLRYPSQPERSSEAWIPNLAQALQTLHTIGLPRIKEIADDRPNICKVLIDRFHTLFQIVWKEDGFWALLSTENKSKLEWVRARDESYVGLLSQAEDLLVHTEPALTHGDLMGDNIMLTQNGRLAITDWGAARISCAFADVAFLLTYMNWSEDERQRFLHVYFRNDPAALEGALPCLEGLSRLYRYSSCVQSLLLLREMGEEALDDIGRAHFERMLVEL